MPPSPARLLQRVLGQVNGAAACCFLRAFFGQVKDGPGIMLDRPMLKKNVAGSQGNFRETSWLFYTTMQGD
jgi:hypothetical protein